MQHYFQDKLIWITGATSGIGFELVQQLNELGARLIISGRRKQILEKIQEKCTNVQKIIAFDLAVKEEIQKAVLDNREILQDLDILVLNAGISQRSLTLDTEFSVYEKLIQVNLMSNVFITQTLLSNLKSKHGQIAVLSSVAGKFGVPLRSGYCASKFALHGYYESLRLEHQELKVNLIVPGFIHTDISKNALKGNNTSHGKMDEGQQNGMPVHTAVKQMLAGMVKNRKEIYVGGFKETRLAVWIHKMFPSLFHSILKNTKST